VKNVGRDLPAVSTQANGGINFALPMWSIAST
jgi:hypothetical protein